MTQEKGRSVKEISNLFAKGLADRDFERISQLVYRLAGIKLPPHKKSMVEARLRRRLRILQMASYEEYCSYLFSPEGEENEIVSLLNEISTNKTDFFREPAHFDLLQERILDELAQSHGAGVDRPLRIWSAGCSSGEEPYTLAMVLSEYRRQRGDYDFSILATDISTKVLEAARLGIYRSEKIAPVPLNLRKSYLLRSRDSSRDQVRVGPELRSKVEFRRVNFMDDEFGVDTGLDIIFCRNVIIYFDKPTQVRLINHFCRHLIHGGYLFMGHSETLHGMTLPLKHVAPSVYRRI